MARKPKVMILNCVSGVMGFGGFVVDGFGGLAIPKDRNTENETGDDFHGIRWLEPLRASSCKGDTARWEGSKEVISFLVGEIEDFFHLLDVTGSTRVVVSVANGERPDS